MSYLTKHSLQSLALSLLLFPALSYASSGHAYIGIQGGISSASLNKKDPQITYYNNYLTDSYPVNNPHNTTSILGVEGGYEFLGHQFMPAIGLGLGFYGTPSAYNYSGQVIETPQGDAPFLLYNYKYHLSTMRLMAEAKFTWTLKQAFMPFIDLGIGSSWNHLSNYKEAVASAGGYIALPAFASNTSNELAYQAGAGVGYAFNFPKESGDFQHERFSLGYRYAYLGNTSFGTRGSSYPYKLKPGALRTQEYYLNFTHFF